MNKQIVVHDFSELKYVLKAGKTPPPVKERKPHKGNWSIFYGTREIESNMPYPVCKQKVNVYKRMRYQWPKPELISIKPYLL